MASSPTRVYRYLRNQLGSLRDVYIRGNRIHRHGDLGERGEVVLLLHGFMQTRAVWEVMEQRLRRDGYGVVSFDLGGLLYRFNSRPIPQLAALVAEKVERLAARHGFDGLHIIGHSKGGLVARHYIQQGGGAGRVRSLITLGTPHHGTPTALIGAVVVGGGLLSRAPLQMLPRSPFMRRLNAEAFPAEVSMTSIFSTGDLVCPWWCSVLRDEPKAGHLRNVKVTGLGHTQLCHDPGVYRVIREALRGAGGTQVAG